MKHQSWPKLSNARKFDNQEEVLISQSRGLANKVGGQNSLVNNFLADDQATEMSDHGQQGSSMSSINGIIAIIGNTGNINCWQVVKPASFSGNNKCQTNK